MLQTEQAENLAAMQSDWPPRRPRPEAALGPAKVENTTTGCLPGCLCPEQGLHHKLCPNGGKSYDYEWRNYTEKAEEEDAWAMFEEVLEHRRRQEDEEGQQGEGGFDYCETMA